MWRRSILEISSHRTVRKNPRHLASQIPSYLSPRKKFSSSSKQDGAPAPGSAGKPPESHSSVSKFVVGGVAVGAAFLAAYQTGYLDQYLKKEQHSLPQAAQINISGESKDDQHLTEHLDSHSSKTFDNESRVVEHAEKEVNNHIPQVENVTEDQVKEKLDIAEEGTVSVKENQLPQHPQSSVASASTSKESVLQSEGNVYGKSTETDTTTGLEEGIQHEATSIQTSAVSDDGGTKIIQPQQHAVGERREDISVKNIEQPLPLLQAYHLRDKAEENTPYYLFSQGFAQNGHSSEEKEALNSAMKDLNDGYISKDGKLVLNFLQAIHAAEKRQADLDARVFNEEKRVLKEKYEKKLKDAAARELMLAEEAAMLDKELKRERTKAASALKSLQERMEEKLRMELEQKENEAEANLRKVEDLSKAELNAAIANEKAAQIEKMAEANININALCMAFYARSEEARQSHAAHKLALAALALEDALSKGLPIQAEIASLQSYLKGIDKDSVLDLVLASLPEEARNNGTVTISQLNHKFDALKGTIRHFIFFPPGRGGILAHSLAQVASWLKVREADQSGDGIESVLNKVESYLVEGKLAEAADVLEESVRGTQAAKVAADWVKQARNRAITEQAFTLLQSYATSISVT
ncbi:hypothetical protein L6164_012352 [Bauhinia variegata]|uniref:Uncharacterized protein n=1 Tax=Bauhinia variegata TaxID=167791 RepID=A0ACB9P8S1_BAUVA|nr:hypothetical protein L6164_012352 [Bauhinia variegata]